MKKTAVISLFCLVAVISVKSIDAVTAGKGYGVILAAGEGGSYWKERIREVGEKIKRRTPGKNIPFEIVYEENVSAFQRAVNRIEQKKVKKIILIPAYLNSSDVRLEYISYLFGLAKEPPAKYLRPDKYKDDSFGSKSFFKRKEKFEPEKSYPSRSLKQVKIKTPLVITSAVDADLIKESVKKNLKKFTFFLKKSCLVICTESNALMNLNAAAMELKEETELASVKMFFLAPGEKTKQNEESEKTLKKYVQNTSLSCKTIVAGFSLYEKHLDKMINNALYGTFYNYAETATPDAAMLEKWVRIKIKQGEEASPAEKFTYENKRESGLWRKVF